MRALFFNELDSLDDIVRQCDACLDNVFFSTQSTIEIDQPYSINPFDTIMIKENSFIILTTTAIALVNQKAIDFLNRFSLPKQLTKLDNISRKFIEYGFLYNREPKIIEKIDKITAWIHLTDACNLHCSYCFLPHEPHYLTIKRGKKIIDSLAQISKEEGLKKLKLKYAGGEPLQNFSTLQALHQYAMELDIEIDASILTNGTLLNSSIIKWIKTNGIKLVISLDNIETKTPQRVYLNGKDSSYRVQKNIELALSNGVIPSITITISNKNIETLPKLLEWILSKKLLFSLNFYKGSELVDTNKITEGMLKTFEVIQQNPPKQSLLNSLLDMTNLSQPHLRSCSMGQNYLIFDTQGEIAQCPMTLNHPITNLDSPSILADIQNKNNPLQNSSVDKIDECKECQWRYWCGGGCSVINSGEKSPYCDVYKRLFPEILRLEGERLGTRIKGFGVA